MLEGLRRIWSAKGAPASAPAVDGKRRGNELLAQGRLPEAAQAYREAAAADPRDPSVLVNLGYALLEDGKPGDACTALDAALGLDAAQHEAWFLRARADRALGDLPAARAGFERALRLAPAFEHAWLELADVHAELGDAAAANACVERAVAAAPPDAGHLATIGQALLERGRPDDATAAFDRALTLDGNHLDALLGAGFGRLHAQRHEEALALFDRALAADPRSALGYLHRATALLGLGREAEALASLQTCLGIHPGWVDAIVNRGGVLQHLRRHDEAIQAYDEALALSPGHAVAHWNRGLSHLVLGDLGAGWPDNEWRWQALGRAMFGAPAPLWTGAEPIAGKRILVHAEQGFGDAIQFVRYVGLLVERDATVLLRVPAALAGLLGRVHGVHRLVGEDEPMPVVDFHCPLLSLPLAFGTRLPTIPWPGPYVEADPAAVRAWRERLGADGRLRVGLVWAGNPRHVNDRNRSLRLEQLLPALAVDGVRFVSVQKEVRPQDVALLRSAGVEDLGSQLADFTETAALVACLDAVVTVDTSVAHLAGALGARAWVLLPFNPDWRWLLGRADSPWYPSLTLLRQQRPRDWAAPLADARQALQQLQAESR